MKALDLDSTKFVKRPAVPILDAHQGEHAGKPYELDRKRLQEIAENTNRRCQRGDYVLLTIGHTNLDGPELQQPPVVGYAKNIRVDEHADKAAIVADFYFAQDKYETAMQFPRRSVEWWLNADFIDVVSLLVRAPKRDLGLLTFNLEANSHNYPHMGEPMTNTEIEELVDSKVKSYLARFESVDDSARAKDTEDPQDLSHAEEEDKKAKSKNESEVAQNAAEEKPAEKEDEKEDMSADAACAGGSNTAVPAEEKKRMAAEQSLIEVARFQQEITDLKSQNAALVAQLRRVDRERDLVQLEAEGFRFDRAEELEHCSGLDEVSYASHLERVRKLYQRYPLGGGIVRTAEVGAPGMDADKGKAIVSFAQKHRITDFAEAAARYNKEIN